MGIQGNREGISSESKWEEIYAGKGGKNVDLRKQVKKNDTQLKSSGLEQKDALERSIEADRKGLTTIEGGGRLRRSGERPISLKSNNPVLDTANESGSTPPKGAGGTGNPFFAINPMAIFFKEFLKMIEMQKQMQLITNKLAIADAGLILNMAQDQAHAIIKEAEVQADTLTKQAVMSFVEAGMSAVQMGASIYGGVQARKEVNAERKQQALATKDAKNALNEAKAGAGPLSKNVNMNKGKLKGQEDMLKDVDRELANVGPGKTNRKLTTAPEKKPKVPGKDDMTIRDADAESMTIRDADTDDKLKANQKKLDAKQNEIDANKADIENQDTLIDEKNQEIDDFEEDNADLLEDTIANKADPNSKAKRDELKELKDERDALLAKKQEYQDQRSDLIKDKDKLEIEASELTCRDNFRKNNKDLEDKLDTVDKKLADNDKIIKDNEKWIRDNPHGTAVNKKQKQVDDAKLENGTLEQDRETLLKEKKAKLEENVKASKAEVGAAQTQLDKNDNVKTKKEKYERELQTLQDMDKTSYMRSVQNLQGKPWYMAMQAGTGAISQAAKAMSSLFQAKGGVEAAEWEAKKTLLSAHQQILQAAMNAMTQQRQDSFQQANDLAQTLIKISDQEQASMHWSA